MQDFLWGIVPWGYQVLLQVEGLRRPWLDAIMAIITDVGSEIAYLVILSLMYWCVSKPVGQGLAYAYLSAMTVNTGIKDLFRIPRPDDPALDGVLARAGVARRLSPLRHEESFSFISGHSQGAVVSWGYVAARFRKAWIWVSAVILMLLIGFSRIYLGAHFPQDVLGGWAVGALFLALWVVVERGARLRLSRLSWFWRYALAGGVPLLLLVVRPAESTATAMGAALGLGVGYVLEAQTLRFSTAGAWRQRVLRGALGLVLLLIAYLGLSRFFGLFDERAGQVMSLVWRVLRYALVGLVGGWAAPWLFVRVGLAGRDGG